MPETVRLASAVSTSYFTATTTTTATATSIATSIATSTLTQTVKELLDVKIKEMPSALASGTSTETLVKTFSASTGTDYSTAAWLVAGGILLGVGITQLTKHAFRQKVYEETRKRVPIPAHRDGVSWKLKAMLALYRVQKNAEKIVELENKLKEADKKTAALKESFDTEVLLRVQSESEIKRLKKDDGSAVAINPKTPLPEGGETLRRKTPTGFPGLPVVTPRPADASSGRPIKGIHRWMDNYMHNSALKVHSGEITRKNMDSGFRLGVEEYRRSQREKQDSEALGSEDDIQDQLLSEMGSSPPQRSLKDVVSETISLADELTASQRREVGDADYVYDQDEPMASIEEESEVSEGAPELTEQRTTVETTITAPPKLDMGKIPNLGPSRGIVKRGSPRKTVRPLSPSPSPSPSRRTRADRSPSKGVGSSQAATRRSTRAKSHVAGSLSEKELARRSTSPRKGD
jgi:hypothetical protein